MTVTNLLEAVGNLLEWDNGETMGIPSDLIADLRNAAKGLDVFRFKNPQDITDDLQRLRQDMVRDNTLSDAPPEVHLETLDIIIHKMRDTLREKEKPSEVLGNVVEEDCPLCNTRHPHVGIQGQTQKSHVASHLEVGEEAEGMQAAIDNITSHVGNLRAGLDANSKLLSIHAEELIRLSSLVNTDGIRLNQVEGRLRSQEHEVQQQALPRIRSLEANEGKHDEEVHRLGSVSDGDGTRLSRLEITIGDGNEQENQIIRRLAERLSTLENWTTAHRSAERPHGIAAEEVENEG